MKKFRVSPKLSSKRVTASTDLDNMSYYELSGKARFSSDLDLLEAISNYPDASIRRDLFNNRFKYYEILTKLAQDEDKDIRESAKRRLDESSLINLSDPDFLNFCKEIAANIQDHSAAYSNLEAMLIQVLRNKYILTKTQLEQLMNWYRQGKFNAYFSSPSTDSTELSVKTISNSELFKYCQKAARRVTITDNTTNYDRDDFLYQELDDVLWDADFDDRELSEEQDDKIYDWLCDGKLDKYFNYDDGEYDEYDDDDE